MQQELDLITRLIEVQPQVQYSLYDQIVVLHHAAVRLGLYDAADYLSKIIERSICYNIQNNI